MIDEKKLITDRALKLLEDWNRPIILDMDIANAVGLIGMVQLALRHPVASQSQSARMTKDLLLSLIHNIDPSHGDVYKFLMMGFDPAYDAAGIDYREAVRRREEELRQLFNAGLL